MNVRDKLREGTWIRSMHEPRVSAKEIAAQEKVLQYLVKSVLSSHRTAVVGAEELTAVEHQDVSFCLKRIMDESIEMAAKLEGVGMDTITELMATTYDKKQKDYGDSFGETQRLFGVVAGAGRVHDKVSRMLQLMARGRAEVEEERLSDTVRDLGTYAAMMLCWLSTAENG